MSNPTSLTDRLRDRARLLNPGGRQTMGVEIGEIVITDPLALSDLLDEAATRLERYEREGIPGKMHAVDRAFYNLTLLQRDGAWRELEAMRDTIETVRAVAGR